MMRDPYQPKVSPTPFDQFSGLLHLKRDYCTLTQCFVTALDVLELLTNIGKLQENPTEDNSEKIRSKLKQIHLCTLVIIFISSFKKHLIHYLTISDVLLFI